MEKIAKKVLVLGSTGMFGHVMCQVIHEQTNHSLYNISFRNKLNENTIICDVTQTIKLQETLKELKPDIIINCVGVLIKGSQSNPSNAIFINGYLPNLLSEICQSLNAKLIHISTDCVFSGKKGNYLETDFRDADDVYGRSKALGEINNDRDLTIRTSIIGPEIKSQGEGLLHWFLNQRKPINGYSNAYWSGVTTLELAKGVVNALEKELTGLIHFTNETSINKYELLNLFKTTFDTPVEIKNSNGKKINKTLKTIRQDWNYKVPKYEVMIQDMKFQMEKHSSLYNPIYTF